MPQIQVSTELAQAVLDWLLERKRLSKLEEEGGSPEWLDEWGTNDDQAAELVRRFAGLLGFASVEPDEVGYEDEDEDPTQEDTSVFEDRHIPRS
jgi:hypothetical protein